VSSRCSCWVECRLFYDCMVLLSLWGERLIEWNVLCGLVLIVLRIVLL